MDVILIPLMQLIMAVINIYVWIVVAGVVLTWLTAFGIVNTSNRAVYLINDFIYRVTEPALRPIRNLLPNMGAVDLSPVVLILLLWFLESILLQVIVKVV